MISLASILILGIFSQWFAARVKIPAILPLIIAGLLVGPISTIFLGDGQKLLEVGEVFNEEYMYAFVSLAVGVILFEGGLTLRLKEIKELERVVTLLVVVGSVVTMLGGAFAANYFMDIGWEVALLFGALVIVTGPTVIGPMLHNIKPNAKVSTILRWEGVVIDPVGAMIVVLVYEYINAFQGSFQIFNLANLLLLVACGMLTGMGFAFMTRHLLTKNLIPEKMKNVILLALVVTCFSFAEFFYHESGLLATTLFGARLTNYKNIDIKEVLSFKQDVAMILISVLFIVLSANIDLEVLEMLGWQSFMVLGFLMIVVRPVVIFLSTLGSSLNFKERVFLSWISPRGIVAAGVASIFSLKLQQGRTVSGLSDAIVADAAYLLPLTFLVIIGTVMIQGATAKKFASWLDVTKKEPNGIVFIGANDISIFLAHKIKELNIPVLISDTSLSRANLAEASDIPTYTGSLLVNEEMENIDLSVYGQVWAMTSNPELNKLAVKLLKTTFGNQNVYRLITYNEIKEHKEEYDQEILFDTRADFINLVKTLREDSELNMRVFSHIHDIHLFVEENHGEIIPMFLRTHSGRVIPYHEQLEEVETPFRLYYIDHVKLSA